MFVVNSDRVSWPHRAGVPPPIVPDWQQRPVDLRLNAERGHVILSGIGGVGKTQSAARYAEQRFTSGDVELLVWVTATDRDAVVAAYSRIAFNFLALTGCRNADRPAAALVEWLGTTDTRWLIVLDDLTDPADLAGLLPSSEHGQVVVTTRRDDDALEEWGRVHRVTPFTPDEAQEFLASRLHSTDLTESTDLAADLGYLPLALSHAVAYLHDQGLDCAGYRHEFNSRKPTLTELFPDQAPDDHRVTVATTCALSLEAHRRELHGITTQVLVVASGILAMTSLLAPNGIPRGMFHTDEVRRQLTTNGRTNPNAEQVLDAVLHLARHNLAVITDEQVQVHGLVQQVVRDQIVSDDLERFAFAAADGLLAIWSGGPYERGRLKRANALSLYDNAADVLIHYRPDPDGPPEPHPLLENLGHSLSELLQETAATRFFKRVHTACKNHYGYDDSRTIRFLIFLIRWSADAAGTARGMDLIEELLADHLRVLGPDHVQTLRLRYSRALRLGEIGDVAGQIAAYEALLADQLRVLGPDHSDIRATRGNLSALLRKAGDVAGREERLIRQAADIRPPPE